MPYMVKAESAKGLYSQAEVLESVTCFRVGRKQQKLRQNTAFKYHNPPTILDILDGVS